MTFGRERERERRERMGGRTELIESGREYSRLKWGGGTEEGRSSGFFLFWVQKSPGVGSRLVIYYLPSWQGKEMRERFVFPGKSS